MNVGRAQEEATAAELTLPVQFRGIRHAARAASPEMILAVSVVGQAANDLRHFRFARRRREQRLYREAYEWIASNDRSWPYAFPNLCDALGLATESARAQLLGDGPSVAPARFRGALPRLPDATGDRATAMAFRLTRPANVTRMPVARRAEAVAAAPRPRIRDPAA
jgi:hypothetical protein